MGLVGDESRDRRAGARAGAARRGLPLPQGGARLLRCDHRERRHHHPPGAGRARAHKEGAAAQGAVQGKRRKYAPDKHPAATLVPFAVEALGRPSEEAVQFLRDLAPSDPAERAVVLKAAHYRLSTLIAMRQAELLMAAEGASVYGGAPRKPQLAGVSRRLADLDLDGPYVDECKSSVQPGDGPPGWAGRIAQIQPVGYQ